MARTEKEKALFMESEPTVFSDGAHYQMDPAAKAERVEREREIDQTLRKEGLIKDEFKGLDADEALKVGEEVKLGGVEVTIDDDDEAFGGGGGGGGGGDDAGAAAGAAAGGDGNGGKKKKKTRRGMPKKLRERMERQKAAAAAAAAAAAGLPAGTAQ